MGGGPPTSAPLHLPSAETIAAWPVVRRRDYRTLRRVAARLGAPDLDLPGARDHHESDWRRRYFAGSA